MSYTTNMWYPRWELRSEEAVSFQDCKVIETFIKGFYLQPALSLSLSLQRHQVCPSSCWCRAFFHSVLRELDGFAISSFLSDGETMEPKNSAPKKTRQANIPAVFIHKHLPRVLNCPKYARYTSVHKYICMYMLLIHKSQLTTSTHEKTHYQKMAEDLSF